MTKIRSRPPLPSGAAIDSGRWMKLCKLIFLPDQARRELEDAIARYRTNENAHLPAATVRASLLRLAHTASRLATLIDALGDREHYELIEASDQLSVLGNCLEFLASARSQTALLGTWSAAAGAQATERPGSNPIWLHSLVRNWTKSCGGIPAKGSNDQRNGNLGCTKFVDSRIRISNRDLSPGL